METESGKEMETESGKKMEVESGKHQQELFILHEEIMSLASERKKLLASLTPNLFVWEDEPATARRPAFNSQQQVRKEQSSSTWRLAGKATVQKMDSSLAEPAAAAAASGARPNWQPEELENYFDSILQDMEDLGHRMLSIADNSISRKLDAPISLYKKTEIFGTAARLAEISEDLSNHTIVYLEAQAMYQVEASLEEALASHALASYAREEEDAFAGEARGVDVLPQAEAFASRAIASYEREEEALASRVIASYAREEETFAGEAREEALSAVGNMALPNEFLRLYDNYLEHPNTYTKHLALIITEEEKKELEEEEMKKKEEEEKKMKEEEGKAKGRGKKKKKEKNKNKEEEEEDYDGVFGEETESREYLKKRMVLEQGFFSNHRVGWEQIWGSKIGRCGGFQDTTTLSPMHFTHCTPGIIPHGSVVGTTLQIYSFEIELKADLKWPLCVYGVVAARDTVDHNRNLLFCRSRVNYQVVTRDDPFLRLTGPSRAILALDPVIFEAQLKIIDGHESQDRALISLSLRCIGWERTIRFHSSLCTGKLLLEPIDGTLQATIVGVRLAKGDWPFKYGARVACSAIVKASPVRELLLLDSHGEEVTVGADGYLPLSRNVVSVELNTVLGVAIQAYSESGRISAQGHVYISRPKHCNIHQAECSVGNCWVEITVAWSSLVQDKMDLLTEGYAAQA